MPAVVLAGPRGLVDQLADRHPCKVEAVGSNPTESMVGVLPLSVPRFHTIMLTAAGFCSFIE